MVALILLLAAALCRLASGQGFAYSCNARTAQLSGGHWLGMYCMNLNTAVYGYNWTWIDLNWCLGNSEGQLLAYKNGVFSQSCSNCSTVSTGKDPAVTLEVSCDCAPPSGPRVNSTLDLNTVLFNSDGCMGCFGKMGNKTLAGP